MAYSHETQLSCCVMSTAMGSHIVKSPIEVFKGDELLNSDDEFSLNHTIACHMAIVVTTHVMGMASS